MIKVIGISGSPRKGGNTEILVKNALEAAKTEGADTEIILLSELIIKTVREKFNIILHPEVCFV